KEPLSSGYALKRTVEPVQQKEQGRLHVGDVLRVKLEITAATDRTWVVLTDPVPAGATILGSGLGRDSRMLTRPGPAVLDYDAQAQWPAVPAFVERLFEAYRAYFEYF